MTGITLARVASIRTQTYPIICPVALDVTHAALELGCCNTQLSHMLGLASVDNRGLTVSYVVVHM